MISSSSLTRNDIERRVRKAVEELRRHDGYLLDVDANERSITHHLAVYLQQEFEYWHVDVEYNRDGHDIKSLSISSDESEDNVLPDIIVHTRGTNNDNLLVVEMKKRGSENGSDEKKLIEFTKHPAENGLGYRWGVHLILDYEATTNDSLRWYEQGRPCDE